MNSHWLHVDFLHLHDFLLRFHKPTNPIFPTSTKGDKIYSLFVDLPDVFLMDLRSVSHRSQVYFSYLVSPSRHKTCTYHSCEINVNYPHGNWQLIVHGTTGHWRPRRPWRPWWEETRVEWTFSREQMRVAGLSLPRTSCVTLLVIVH